MAWIEDISKRGRKVKVEYDDTNPRKQRATFTIHDQHYHDGSAWQPVVEDFEDDGADGFAKKCAKTRHTIRVGNGGERRWYPRREVATEYLSITNVQYWRTTGGGSWRNLNLPTPAWSAQKATWDMANLKATLTNTWRQQKSEFVLKDSSAPTRIRFAHTLTGLTWDGWALKSIADGTVVGWMTPPVGWDATKVAYEDDPNVTVTATNAGGYIEYSANVTGKTFPIVVDPTFTDGDGGDVTSAFDGGVNTAAADTAYNTAVYFRIYDTTRIPLIKWDLSGIAATSTCDSASFWFYTYIGPSVGTATQHIHAILAANSGWVEACTWNHADGAGASDHWAGDAGADGGADAGCSVSDTDFSAASIGTFQLTQAEALGTEHEVALTASAVEDWFGAASHGMLIHSDLGALSQGICSSDHATAGYHPKLVVTYTEAAGGGKPWYVFAQA